MSRSAALSQQRPLSLTEELEKLEQSITLTLQEIDHNFSRAHRIVTSSILPIVDQYANHSKEVWEGSKFWKQFFESSANVSLSGYEEQPSVQETEETMTEDSNATTHTTLETSESYETPAAQHISTDSIQDLDLSNLTISPSHSTPRPPKNQQVQSRDYTSPYGSLRQEVNTATTSDRSGRSKGEAPRTPGRQTSMLDDDVAMTPEDSPSLPQRPASTTRPGTSRKASDPLLHRILDKNYRVQATPLTSGRHISRPMATPATGTRNFRSLVDTTLDSSPDVAPPELHEEIFDSPERRAKPLGRPQQRTPGVSVLTPARNKSGREFDLKPPAARTPGIWDSDDDEDDGIDEATGMPYGASPPKTMQFHIPQSRLLKTPAREASKQMVDNILASAGLGRNGHHADTFSDDFEVDVDAYDQEEVEDEENSPSVVRRAVGLDDETF